MHSSKHEVSLLFLIIIAKQSNKSERSENAHHNLQLAKLCRWWMSRVKGLKLGCQNNENSGERGYKILSEEMILGTIYALY